mmetsp:Transcript_27028/g.70110  ORF Transcript_27028/g.70110 Transcript_27028/m.70110 type:complete len:310 (-) Transcript_27028:1910-2839(-)
MSSRCTFLAVVMATLIMAYASAASVHDVMPITESTNIWGTMPYNGLQVHAGTKVTFRVPTGYHDIALVTNHTEMDNCDMSNVRVVVDTEGVIQPEFSGAGNSVTFEGGLYIFTWTVTEARDYYIVSTVPRQCLAGQKFELEVEAASDPSPDATVTGAPVPFWTVGVEYPDMTIRLGDSLRFVSDNQGLHDIVLLTSTCGKSTNFDCCGDASNGIVKFIDDHEAAELYHEADFVANPEFIWTPTETGVYDLVCGEGQHCQHGQRFTLTVVEASDAGSKSNQDPTSNAASSIALLATTLKAMAVTVLVIVV